MAESRFTVLLKNPESIPIDKISRILAQVHGETAFDGLQKARGCWGFLAEHAVKDLAEKLAAAAKAAGLETLSLPDGAVPALPDPEIVHAASCAENAFVHNLGTGAEKREIPWDEISLVAACGLKEEVATMKTVKQGPSVGQKVMRAGIMLATGIPIGLGKSKNVRKEFRETELYLYLDLYRRQAPTGLRPFKGPRPPGEGAPNAAARLRIHAQEFNFAYLAERRQTNIFANFRLLLQDVVRLASKAARNKGARVILAGQPINTMGYQSVEEFEKEARWLLALQSPGANINK